MKRVVFSSLLIVSLFGVDQPLSEKEAESILKSSYLYKQLENAKKQGAKIRVAKKGEFFVVEISGDRGKGTFYITKDKKYTILGQVIDNRTKKPLLANFPKNKALINKGVMFTFGNGKKEIYLVTDPECPFCRMMEKEKKEILRKNYKVHVILMPLSFHKNAKNMSYYILAGKTDKEKAKRLQEVLSGSEKWKNYRPTQKEKEKFDKELQNAKKAAIELGARGTPSVFDKDFNPISWPKLGEKNEN